MLLILGTGKSFPPTPEMVGIHRELDKGNSANNRMTGSDWLRVGATS